MKGYKNLEAAVDEFNEKYPRPGLSPLKIDGPYDLDNDWESTYPNAGSPGVYVFLDQEEELLYIGKASRKNVLGRRLSSYFGHNDKGGWKLHKPHEWEPFGRPKYIYTITLPAERAFEAPAIEEYLIVKLEPKAGG